MTLLKFQERDEALVDLRRTIVERDSLRERLKISTDNQIADKAHLEQQIEDLNGRLRILQNDKNQLEMQVYTVLFWVGNYFGKWVTYI